MDIPLLQKGNDIDRQRFQIERERDTHLERTQGLEMVDARRQASG